MFTWVLEREVFSDRDDALAEAAEESGARVLNWQDEWWLDGRWPRESGAAVVFHGSLANADRVARELSWSPGAYCSTERLDCSAWFGDRVFVRPDSALKPFSGRVLGASDLSLSALDHGYCNDDLDLPLPKSWALAWFRLIPSSYSMSARPSPGCGSWS